MAEDRRCYRYCIDLKLVSLAHNQPESQGGLQCVFSAVGLALYTPHRGLLRFEGVKLKVS